jgi:hypothetical protein
MSDVHQIDRDDVPAVKHNGEYLAQRDRRALSDRERQAAALLFRDGWTLGELALTFQTGEKALRRNLKFEGAMR